MVTKIPTSQLVRSTELKEKMSDWEDKIEDEAGHGAAKRE
jgi:hypothetical protein